MPTGSYIRTEAHRKLIGQRSKGKQSGEKHWNWKGGRTPEIKRIKNSLEFKLWREAVFKKDNYICVWCGSTENLSTDHIKPWADYPELRFAIDNGRVLCINCHRSTDSWGRHKQ